MVVHNEAKSRFELALDGDLAVLEYRRTPDSMIFTHTGVPPAFEGRGYGGQLARAALDYARAAGLKIVPLCSFIAAFIKRNPVYATSVPGAYRDTAPPSCEIRRS
ncbi:MAG TPA: GNAT family N-acetyltransferase [Bryobacteraceae bacterium]|nr:GNAT family N-acetyltransferase [Bryobacteraceae bacterium]